MVVVCCRARVCLRACVHSRSFLLVRSFRDLKPANVLVFDDFSARLTDFDTVKYEDASRNPRAKTVYHHGPSGGFHKAFIAGTLVYVRTSAS